MPDHDVGSALTGMLAEMLQDRTAMNFIPPAPQGADLVLPSMGVETRGIGAPQISGGLRMPTGADSEIGLRGRYQKAFPDAPANVGAMLDYRRRF